MTSRLGGKFVMRPAALKSMRSATIRGLATLMSIDMTDMLASAAVMKTNRSLL